MWDCIRIQYRLERYQFLYKYVKEGHCGSIDRCARWDIQTRWRLENVYLCLLCGPRHLSQRRSVNDSKCYFWKSVQHWIRAKGFVLYWQRTMLHLLSLRYVQIRPKSISRSNFSVRGKDVSHRARSQDVVTIWNALLYASYCWIE